MSELVLTEAEANRTFDVRVGTPVAIQLAEQPATGYRWSVEDVDEALLRATGSDFASAPTRGVGGSGVRTIRFTAQAPGRARLTLVNRRPWESPAGAARHFAVTFNIGA